MIVIEGAGIAGLTLANCLEIQGIDYRVIEQASEIKPIGAGIAVQSNGLAILQALGLEQDVTGCNIEKMTLAGKYFRQELMPDKGWKVKMVHRATLHHALLKNIPSSKLLLGAEISSHSSTEDSVTCHLADGSDLQGNCLVVASGIHTETHNKPYIRDSGQWCWRTVISGNAERNEGGEYWFDDFRIGVSHIGDGDYYIYQVAKTAQQITEEQRLVFWQRDDVRARFPFLDVKKAVWLSHPLTERRIDWGQGNVVAIGDAAHALTPNMGQGAVLAMEDAYTLATLLNTDYSTDWNTLAEQLSALRHQRVKGIQQQSWLFGMLAHWSNPITVLLRDIAMRLSPTDAVLRQQITFFDRFIARMAPLIPDERQRLSQ
ncbi:FAD-dependent monooxygenase [Veronia nyctiphanis]|nr:FAD-dependent monooxygenase [Veronia nyctiphanis]